jgi:O-antigen/teichoic acid export membrane protein
MLARWASIAALACGVAGGIAGLVIGLFAYAPTALFAAVEIGLPAVFAGAVVGLVAGIIMKIARRMRRHGATSR